MHKSVHWILTVTAAALLAVVGTGCTAKMKASYHLHRAERYYGAGQYSEAEIEYQKVLRGAPENAEAWARLGLMLFDQGRALEAASVLARAAQVAPDNLDVHLKLGAIYLAAGQVKKARDEAEIVLARRPKDNQAPILLANTATTNDLAVIRQRLEKLRSQGDSAPLEVARGILAMKEKDFKTAEADFQHAATLDPKFSGAYTALGSLYLAQKEMKQADTAYQKAAELAPPRSGSSLRYAEFKLLSGDSTNGERLLREIVKKTPDYLPAWMSLAQLAAAQKDYTNAASLLGNVLSRDPRNFGGLALQGRLDLLEGRTTKAVTAFERMAKMFPRAPSARFQLAQAYLANRNTNAASDSLNQALNLNTNYVAASLLLAEIQIRSGNIAPAIVSMRQLIQQQPRLVPAWLLLADAYRAQGTLDRAAEVIQNLAKAYPKSPQVPLLLGTVYLQQKKSLEARAEFEKSLQLAPDNLPALERLVDLDLTEKQYTAALQRVQQMAVKNPDRAALQVLLGKTLVAQGETNQAETALSKAITLQPDSQAAYLMLAQLHTMSGKNQEALSELQTALDKDPKDIAALMMTGIIYDSQQDYEKARDAYVKMLALAPDNGAALNNLACDYADHLGQLDKAYPLARRAREVAPTNPSIADTLGWILYRRGQYGPALDLLRESAGKLSKVPVIQFHLGMADYMTGNETEARGAFQKALQLPGEFAERAECRQRLGILNIDPQKAGADSRVSLEKWTASHPDDPVALGRLAAIYQRMGNTDKAITTYQAALNASPQNVAAMVNLARLYMPTDVQKAYAFAKSAYQLTPNDPEVSHLTGRLAFQTGDYQWALSLLQLTAQAQPNDPDVLFDLGEAFYSQGKVSEARKAMRNALQAGAGFAGTNEVRQFLAMTALVDQPARALLAQAQVGKILKSRPDYVPALMVQALIESQKGDDPGAEQTYERVLKRYPDFTPAEKQLAILYSKDPENDSRTYALAVKAQHALPGDLELAGILGEILYRQGNYSRAIGLLEQSARQKNQNAELMYYLGMTQYRLKHAAESKAALQQALALNLSGKQANEAKQILADLK